MIKINAAHRLLAAPAENHQWIKPVMNKKKMLPKPPSSDLVKPQTYNGSPQSIAQELKRVHKELAPAIAALNFYYNKFGKHISADDSRKRDAARKALRKLFGADKKKPAQKPETKKSKPKPIGTEPIGTNPVGGR